MGSFDRLPSSSALLFIGFLGKISLGSLLSVFCSNMRYDSSVAGVFFGCAMSCWKLRQSLLIC